MKKLISGLIAAFLLSAGFVAVSAETASAACGKQYQPVCVATTVKAGSVKVKPGKRGKITVQVRSNGNVKPVGTVKLTIKPGGKVIKGTIKRGKVAVNLPKLKPGKYKVTIAFTPAASSNFKASSKTVTVTVLKKKKRR